MVKTASASVYVPVTVTSLFTVPPQNDGVTVCVLCSKKQAGAEDCSPIGFLFPKTEYFVCLYFQAARLKY
jgi:hypothetical protein